MKGRRSTEKNYFYEDRLPKSKTMKKGEINVTNGLPTGRDVPTRTKSSGRAQFPPVSSGRAQTPPSGTNGILGDFPPLQRSYAQALAIRPSMRSSPEDSSAARAASNENTNNPREEQLKEAKNKNPNKTIESSSTKSNVGVAEQSDKPNPLRAEEKKEISRGDNDIRERGDTDVPSVKPVLKTTYSNASSIASSYGSTDETAQTDTIVDSPKRDVRKKAPVKVPPRLSKSARKKLLQQKKIEEEKKKVVVSEPTSDLEEEVAEESVFPTSTSNEPEKSELFSSINHPVREPSFRQDESDAKQYENKVDTGRSIDQKEDPSTSKPDRTHEFISYLKNVGISLSTSEEKREEENKLRNLVFGSFSTTPTPSDSQKFFTEASRAMSQTHANSIDGTSEERVRARNANFEEGNTYNYDGRNQTNSQDESKFHTEKKEEDSEGSMTLSPKDKGYSYDGFFFPKLTRTWASEAEDDDEDEDFAEETSMTMSPTKGGGNISRPFSPKLSQADGEERSNALPPSEVSRNEGRQPIVETPHMSEAVEKEGETFNDVLSIRRSYTASLSDEEEPEKMSDTQNGKQLSEYSYATDDNNSVADESAKTVLLIVSKKVGVEAAERMENCDINPNNYGVIEIVKLLDSGLIVKCDSEIGAQGLLEAISDELEELVVELTNFSSNVVCIYDIPQETIDEEIDFIVYRKYHENPRIIQFVHYEVEGKENEKIALLDVSGSLLHAIEASPSVELQSHEHQIFVVLLSDSTTNEVEQAHKRSLSPEEARTGSSNFADDENYDSAEEGSVRMTSTPQSFLDAREQLDESMSSPLGSMSPPLAAMSRPPGVISPPSGVMSPPPGAMSPPLREHRLAFETDKKGDQHPTHGLSMTASPTKSVIEQTYSPLKSPLPDSEATIKEEKQRTDLTTPASSPHTLRLKEQIVEPPSAPKSPPRDLQVEVGQKYEGKDTTERIRAERLTVEQSLERKTPTLAKQTSPQTREKIEVPEKYETKDVTKGILSEPSTRVQSPQQTPSPLKQTTPQRDLKMKVQEKSEKKDISPETPDQSSSPKKRSARTRRAAKNKQRRQTMKQRKKSVKKWWEPSTSESGSETEKQSDQQVTPKASEELAGVEDTQDEVPADVPLKYALKVGEATDQAKMAMTKNTLLVVAEETGIRAAAELEKSNLNPPRSFGVTDIIRLINSGVIIKCDSEEGVYNLEEAIIEEVEGLSIELTYFSMHIVCVHNLPQEISVKDVSDILGSQYEETPINIDFVPYEAKWKQNQKIALLDVGDTLLDKMKESPTLEIEKLQYRIQVCLQSGRKEQSESEVSNSSVQHAEVVINNLPDDISVKDLTEIVFNKYEENPAQVQISPSEEDKNTKTAKLEVGHGLLKKIVLSPEIPVGWSERKIETPIEMHRCARCQLLGHETKFCRNQGRNRPLLHEMCLDCCHYNEIDKLPENKERKANHPTDASECPSKIAYVLNCLKQVFPENEVIKSDVLEEKPPMQTLTTESEIPKHSDSEELSTKSELPEQVPPEEESTQSPAVQSETLMHLQSENLSTQDLKQTQPEIPRQFQSEKLSFPHMRTHSEPPPHIQFGNMTPQTLQPQLAPPTRSQSDQLLIQSEPPRRSSPMSSNHLPPEKWRLKSSMIPSEPPSHVQPENSSTQFPHPLPHLPTGRVPTQYPPILSEPPSHFMAEKFPAHFPQGPRGLPMEKFSTQSPRVQSEHPSRFQGNRFPTQFTQPPLQPPSERFPGQPPRMPLNHPSHVKTERLPTHFPQRSSGVSSEKLSQSSRIQSEPPPRFHSEKFSTQFPQLPHHPPSEKWPMQPPMMPSRSPSHVQSGKSSTHTPQLPSEPNKPFQPGKMSSQSSHVPSERSRSFHQHDLGTSAPLTNNNKPSNLAEPSSVGSKPPVQPAEILDDEFRQTIGQSLQQYLASKGINSSDKSVLEALNQSLSQTLVKMLPSTSTSPVPKSDPPVEGKGKEKKSETEAEVVKQVPATAGEPKVRTRAENTMVLIKPVDPLTNVCRELGSMGIDSKNVVINRAIFYPSGDLLLVCDTIEGAQYLRSIITKSPRLGIVPWRGFPSRVKIDFVPQDCTILEISNAIHREFKEMPRRVLFRSPGNRGEKGTTKLALVNVSETLLGRIEKSPSVPFRGRRLKIDTTVRPPRCTNCQLFGHRADVCRSISRGPPRPDDKCLDCSHYNRRLRETRLRFRPRDENHRTGHDACPSITSFAAISS